MPTGEDWQIGDSWIWRLPPKIECEMACYQQLSWFERQNRLNPLSTKALTEHYAR
jgi:hypothetical protein